MILALSIDVNRNIAWYWNVATLVLLVVGLVLAWRTGLLKFGCAVLVCGAAMSLLWEVNLYVLGMRLYDNALAELLTPVPEMIYHAFSETGAPLLVGMLGIEKLGIIDLDRFRAGREVSSDSPSSSGGPSPAPVPPGDPGTHSPGGSA